MNINQERLWNSIRKLGEIGKSEDGGITRLSFTEEEKEAKKFVEQLMEDAGLSVREDEIGNLIGRTNGTEKEKPVILVGSHLDSVFNGGMFDGPAGVLTAIEALHTINEKNIKLTYPVEVIAFTDEEGTRFSTGMLGSKTITGQLTIDELKNAKDKDGVSIYQAMLSTGYEPEKIAVAKRDKEDIRAFLELHIEQGQVLEKKDIPAGIVSAIVGIAWLKVKIKGEAGHAGTTPMWLRKDPLTAAAKVISYAEELAKNEETAVITTGKVDVKPGGINIIPSEVEFTFDIRDGSEENIERLQGILKGYIQEVCKERELECVIEVLHRMMPAVTSETINQILETELQQLNITPTTLLSGAGHDAMVMADLTDIAMIFVRSKNGISHNPKEWTESKDLAIGAELLYRTILQMQVQ